MISRHWIILSVLALAIAPAAAQPAAPASAGNQCFFTTQFENWRAADAKTIYIRVRRNNFYRLAMGGECSAALLPSAQLVTVFRGSNLVCSALDWNMKVRPGLHEIPEPCIVKTMTKLSPAEAAALPVKARP